jgi:hypothetical protein
MSLENFKEELKVIMDMAVLRLSVEEYEALYTDYARKVVLNCLHAAPIVIPASPADKEGET